MSDRELIERLRAVDRMSVEECFLDSFLFAKAADRLQALSAEVEMYREALGFYAREHSWRSCGMYMCGHRPDSTAAIDGGNKARQALKGANNG